MDQEQVNKVPQIVFKAGWPAARWMALLGCVLVVLKALGKITLSWWAVLLPFYWFPALLVGLLILAGLIFCIVFLVVAVIDWVQKRRNIAWRKKQQRLRELDRRTILGE